jgi:spore maturation protein CgeB
MFRGRYNDILEADRHYFALESDFSNIGEVLERFRDPDLCREISESAFDLVMAQHTYAHRMRQVYSVLSQSAAPAGTQVQR